MWLEPRDNILFDAGVDSEPVALNGQTVSIESVETLQYVTPAHRTHVVTWSYDGPNPDNGSGGTTSSFAPIDGLHTRLLWAEEVRLAVSQVGDGTVSEKSAWFPRHQTLNIAAMPAAYYTLGAWSGDLTSGMEQTNPLTLIMDQPRSITASFEHQTVDVAVSNIWSSSTLRFLEAEQHAIAGTDYHSAIVYSADMDGDGDNDVVMGKSYLVAWYENNGSGFGWTEHVVSQISNNTSIQSADLDGDGDQDLLLGFSNYGKLSAWRNDGVDEPWIEIRIDERSRSNRERALGDVDGDGHIDVLSLAPGQQECAWFQNDGNMGGWTKNIITNSIQAAYRFAVGDLDGDHALDVIGTDFKGDRIVWSQNNGSGSNWTEHVITTLHDGVQGLFIADIDNDGDDDVVAGSGTHADGALSWWENKGINNAWVRHVLPFGEGVGKAIFVADMDNDGHLDVLSMVDPGIYHRKGLWWRNEGDGVSWQTQKLKERPFNPQTSFYAKDLNGDGLPEYIMGQSTTPNASWWEVHQPITFSPPQQTVTVPLYGSSVSIASSESEIAIDATSRWHLGRWQRIGMLTHTGPGSTIEPFVLDTTTVVQYFWQKQFWLNTEDGVGTTVRPAARWYDAGSSIIIEAAPYPGYYFSHWAGDLSHTENPTTLLIDRSWSFTGHAKTFAPQSWLDAMGWSPYDSSLDQDGDGFLSWQEAIAGTDALNGSSYLHLTENMSQINADQYIIEWPSTNDRVYRLMRTTNLTEQLSPIAIDIPATPPINVYTDNVSNAQGVYYRIDVLLEE